MVFGPLHRGRVCWTVEVKVVRVEANDRADPFGEEVKELARQPLSSDTHDLGRKDMRMEQRSEHLRVRLADWIVGWELNQHSMRISVYGFVRSEIGNANHPILKNILIGR